MGKTAFNLPHHFLVHDWPPFMLVFSAPSFRAA
jgi:hypothetical protein